MKVLVTGSEGFLGTHLVEFLKSKGHDVWGFDLQKGEDILGGDTSPALDSIVAWADTVIHLAAQANVRLSFEKPADTFLTNTIGSIEVLKSCIRHNKHMIVASTIGVTDRYGSPYAESKALAEDVLKKFDNVTILRFTNLIGLNMNSRSGSLIYWFTQGLKTDKKIKVDGDGSVSRDFIHVRDIVQIIEKAVTEPQQWSGKTVECGTGKNYTVKQIAEMFEEFGGATIVYGPATKASPALNADLTVLQSLYHNNMTTDVRSDIKEIIEHANN